MIFDKSSLEALDKYHRINLLNTISGIKPGSLIGTQSPEGLTNVAVFNSIIHIGSNPPLLGFILRPTGEVPRHTYENILATEYYTINHITSEIYKKAHYTSAKFENESEFDRCELSPEYIEGFMAPFVKESLLQLAMEYRESIPIKANGTILVIGEVQKIIVRDEQFLDDDFSINLEKSDHVGIGGLNSYYKLERLGKFPYARPNQLPDFDEEKI